jgi:oligosaccharide repeat unit polymerase
VLAAAGGLLVVALIVLIGGAPVAWVLLAFVGAVALAILFVQFRRGRFFEPITIFAAVWLISFAARPLQLFINVNDLLSWYFEPSDVDRLLRTENQETALFVTRDLKEGLEPALTRAMGVVAVFVGLVTVAYLLPLGRRLGARMAQVGRNYGGRVDTQVVVTACLLIAFIGQIAVLVKVGGPSGAANNMLNQKVLKSGLAYQVLLGFGTIGLLVWAAWMQPATRAAKWAFGLVAFEVCAYYAIAGTRTRVFLSLLMIAVVTHYLWRPWRLKAVLLGVLVVVVFAAGLLGVRQATERESISSALTSAPTYILDPRGILNDMTEFDGVFTATSIVGSQYEYRRPAPFRHGGVLRDAFTSYIPARIYPDKPESGDIVFRKLVWGKELEAGRPTTAPGDFWWDFGWAGVVIGSLLFGLLARAIAGLVTGGTGDRGREYRVVLYAIALVVLYMELITTYSVALGFVITFMLPFVVAMHVIGPVSKRIGRRVADARGQSRAPA